jgi:hypothetical protein
MRADQLFGGSPIERCVCPEIARGADRFPVYALKSVPPRATESPRTLALRIKLVTATALMDILPCGRCTGGTAGGSDSTSIPLLARR